ncbi:hypothetical protein C8R46DRAFT_372536 [Mycena filopes]|nr:hypothetical protein C8R46DRAFT_372536 [Mycena filopes]
MSVNELPQELVDTIISMVHDTRSLKACAMTSRAFRPRSQRLLMRSMSLKPAASSGGPRVFTFAEACAVLQESPHLVEYIQRLKLFLCFPGDFDGLQEVLEQLVNVVSCSIGSGQHAHFEWFNLPWGIAPAIAAFLERQAAELSLERIIALPCSFILDSTPSLVIYDAQLTQDIAGSPLLAPRTLQSLVLRGRSGSVYSHLSRPELGLHLTRLSINPQHNPVEAVALITAVAQTLEHIHLASGGLRERDDALMLPPLPMLRIASGYSAYPSLGVSGIMRTITSFLATSPHLHQIILTLPSRPNRPPDEVCAALDGALSAHAAAPGVWWRMKRPRVSEEVRGWFPQAEARGRVRVEGYGDEVEYGWPFQRL